MAKAKPTYGKNSFYAPVAPKPKVTATSVAGAPGYQPGMTDAEYEAYLAGGGSWGGYSTPTGTQMAAPSVDPYAGWDQSLAVEVPGEYFDPQKAIQGDWEYEGALQAMNAQNLAARTHLANQRRQALIDLGIIPGTSGVGPAGAALDAEALGDIDDVTRQQIANNPYSAWAQANEQKVRGLDQLQAALGSRGVLRSGATAGGAQQQQRGYERAMYGAERSTLDTLGEALRGYTSGIGERQSQLAQVASSVGSRLAQDPRFQPKTVTAVFDPGRGAYVTQSGAVFDRYGNKIG